jgi:uncharacterized protein YkwD
MPRTLIPDWLNRVLDAFARRVSGNPYLRETTAPGPLPPPVGRRHPYILPGPPGTGDGAGRIDPITTPSAFEAELAGAINQARVAQIRNPLAVNPALSGAARWIARDNAGTGVLSHTGSDGSGPGDRATRAGYRWGFVAENGDEPFPGATPVQVVQDWLASHAGHRENMLASQPTEMGVGEATAGLGRRLVFFLLARPQQGGGEP